MLPIYKLTIPNDLYKCPLGPGAPTPAPSTPSSTEERRDVGVAVAGGAAMIQRVFILEKSKTMDAS